MQPKFVRLHIRIYGTVQGVGFRPFVYRLANESGLKGWVLNSSEGVEIEIEGLTAQVEVFLIRLEKEKPPLAFIRSLEPQYLDPCGYTSFEIKPSRSGEPLVNILPDIATCPECLSELFDPTNRRYLYPFLNCTHCGPRYSIIEALPYDRANTTMRHFTMCAECEREYHDPSNRRFHAQPNACSECGPQVVLLTSSGDCLAQGQAAITATCQAIRKGQLVAVKGLGGFHLVVAATQEKAVLRLREKKHREEKPFALMVPSLSFATALCEVSPLEARLLSSPESPIVILRSRCRGEVTSPLHRKILAPSVAPGNPYLGLMLPYTPLHHLLLNNLQIPIVATSGNLSDEPICVDEQEALERLGGIADLFLIHNRPIRTRGDDSIARIVLGREMILRRARGYAPLPIYLNEGEHATTPAGVMAVGAHLKNTIALRKGRQVFLSQHLGDLDNTESYEAFLRTTHDFPGYYGTQVEQLVCDLHPDYLATQFAVNSQKPVCQVQHHYAHILSCMAENQIDAPVLGVAWDGTGYGLDGEIWGGEFFLVEESSFRRIAHLRSFPLPGGEAAIKDLRRIVLGLLYEMEGDNTRSYLPAHFQNFGELEIILEMLRKSINCPRVCSIGRLFDVVACLCRIKEKVSFEGQAAMELEYMARGMANTQALSPYPSLRCGEGENAIIDWAPMIKQILDDLRKQIPVGEVALRFHNTLVELILTIARRVGIPRVVLSGGCFQNQILLTQAVTRLQELGFQPYWHQRVPPNDGGIALGQIMAFSRDSKMRGSS